MWPGRNVAVGTVGHAWHSLGMTRPTDALPRDENQLTANKALVYLGLGVA